MWLMIKEQAKKRDFDGSHPNSIGHTNCSKQLFSDLQEMLSPLNMPVNLRSSARLVPANRIGSSLLCDEIQKDPGPTTLLSKQSLLKTVGGPFLRFYPVSVSMSFWEQHPGKYQQGPMSQGIAPVCFCPWVERFFCGQWCSWVDSNPLLGSVMTDKLIQSLKEESEQQIPMLQWGQVVCTWKRDLLVGTVPLERRVYKEWLRNKWEMKSKPNIASSLKRSLW